METSAKLPCPRLRLYKIYRNFTLSEDFDDPSVPLVASRKFSFTFTLKEFNIPCCPYNSSHRGIKCIGSSGKKSATVVFEPDDQHSSLTLKAAAAYIGFQSEIQDYVVHLVESHVDHILNLLAGDEVPLLIEFTYEFHKETKTLQTTPCLMCSMAQVTGCKRKLVEDETAIYLKRECLMT